MIDAPVNVRTTLGRLLGYARPVRGRLVAAGLLSLLDVGLNAQLALSFKFVIDEALTGRDLSALGWVTGLLLVSVAVVTLAGIQRDRIYAAAASDLLAGLRSRLFSHLQRLPPAYLDRAPAAGTSQRFTNDLAEIEEAVLNGVASGLLPVLDIAISLVLMTLLDARLAMAGLLAIPLSLALPRILMTPSTAAALERKRVDADLTAFVDESIAARSLIRAFAVEKLFLRLFHAHNLDAAAAARKAGFRLLSMERAALASTRALQGAMLGAGGLLVVRGGLAVGSFAAFQSLFVTLSDALVTLGEYLPALARAGAALLRIEEFLKEPTMADAEPQSRMLAPFSAAIEFRGVSFSPDGHAKVLDGIHLRIPAGASVAFVGSSGSGKSTLLNLAMRFHDPSTGAVIVDGIDLREVAAESWRSQTAVVFQENTLLRATLRENLCIARPGATAEEIDEAMRAAGLGEWIATLPEGYNTLLAPGRLSGGQRQRIGIARALLRRPRVLLLDEATSALDPATEAGINEALARASEGRTVLTVTHRLAAARNASCIYVLDRGRVIERGTHAELLALDGEYGRLWRKQSGFEIRQDGGARVSPGRLREISLLAGLDSSALEELAEAFTTEMQPPDRFVFEEGDPGEAFYILVRGRVEILKVGADGQARRVQVLEDGDTFGEQALLMNAPRSASAKSMAECTLLALGGSKFRELLSRAPELRRRLREQAAIGEFRNAEVASGAISPWSKYRHDLLTPVNHLVGYSEMLAEEIAAAEPLSSAARCLQPLVDRFLPSGRNPAPQALDELRHQTKPILTQLAEYATVARRQARLSKQAEVDLARVEEAIRRFQWMLSEPSASPAARQAAESRLAQSTVSAAGHVLVVDDNEVGRDLLCRHLERDGYAVSWASGGLLALQMAEEADFDLVLLDVLMPDLDGLEILNRWKASGRLARLPVIVTSAMDEAASAVRSIELGAEDYLTKPFDPVRLKARVRASIERKKVRDSERARSERLRKVLETLEFKEQAVKV